MRVSAIVLAHGAEPDLVECVDALRRQVDDVVVVDNDAAPGPVLAAGSLAGVRVLRPGGNLGYAAGCNVAAAAATGEVLMFVNSDAVVRPGAVEALCRRLSDTGVGLVCASVRLGSDPERINSAGNPVHFLMFSWVGGMGDPAAEHGSPVDVASVSGATFAVRREVWQRLGGFDPTYFAYCEDVDLSLRAWQAGYRVVFEPAAVAEHRYEFGRHRAKHYLLERNRLMNLLVLPEARTRRLVLPAAAAVEVGVLLVALRDGWAGEKVAGWRWLVSRRAELRQRRRQVQADRVVPDAVVAERLRGRLDPPPGLGPGVPPVVSAVLDAYWTRVRRWL